MTVCTHLDPGEAVCRAPVDAPIDMAPMLWGVAPCWRETTGEGRCGGEWMPLGETADCGGRLGASNGG